jgi:hypothetical protein
LEGSGRGLIFVLSRYSPGGTEESHEDPQVRTACIRAEISTWDLLNSVVKIEVTDSSEMLIIKLHIYFLSQTKKNKVKERRRRGGGE